MAYSSINRTKFGDCYNPECGRKNTEVVKVGKELFCLYCRNNQKAKVQLEKSKERQKVRSLIKTDANQKNINDNIGSMKQVDIDLIQRKELEFWFKRILMKECAVFPEPNYRHSGSNCWECGAFIPIKYFRAATAHALAKRKEYGFPSVALHEKNYLILGSGCGCHQKYDRSWEDAIKMKVWEVALRKIKEIYPFIHSSELKNIPQILLDQINN